MSSNAVINGFRNDLELLLHKFVKQNSTKFDSFCTEWSRMNFQYIFCGYMCISEMVQFLEEAFVVMKNALLTATSPLEQILALYLMYAMYFKQPPQQYCKFRMTLNEWMKMNQIYNEVCIFHAQSSLVFWKLLQGDAFRFVEAEYEYGFERFLQKEMSKDDDEREFIKINPIVESAIRSMTNNTGIVPALSILQVGYNEMKEHLDQKSSTLAQTSITTEILDGLGTLEKLLRAEDDTTDTTDDINTKRKEIRKNAFKNFENGTAQEGSSSSANKKNSMKYRTSITDDGDFLTIAKAPLNKKNKKDRHRHKTAIKQLDVSLDEDLELSPKAGTSRKIKKEKCGEWISEFVN